MWEHARGHRRFPPPPAPQAASPLSPAPQTCGTGFGGYNTTLAQYVVEEVFSGCTPDNTLAAVIWFGANDAACPMPLGTP
eukprot:364278-Chlamydomonas_euryale.AAC.8